MWLEGIVLGDDGGVELTAEFPQDVVAFQLLWNNFYGTHTLQKARISTPDIRELFKAIDEHSIICGF